MRDALAITTDSQDGLFKQATELLSGTAAPTESTAPGEAAQRAPRDQPELDRIRAKLQTYESYLEALGQIDSAWRVFNSHIRTTAESESARGVIVDRIHALTVLLRNARDDRYRETYQGLRCEFAHLPGKAIEFLANARYLMEEVGRSAESQPIFSGVIVELAKAAEYCCKEMLLRAFAAQLLHENVRSYDIQCPGVGGSTRRVRLLASGKQLYISLGDVAAILRSSEQRLEEFLKTYLGNHRSWVTGILPGVLSVVKDSFRNPSAHNTSATRQEAEKLYDYLRQEQFFEEMDRAGAHLAGLY